MNINGNGIFFKLNNFSKGDLVNDTKALDMVEICVPMYHLNKYSLIKRKGILNNIQMFQKELEEVHLFSEVRCEILDNAVRYYCAFRQSSDLDGVITVDKILQVYDSYQTKIYAIFSPWDIFDIQQRLHVTVYS